MIKFNSTSDWNFNVSPVEIITDVNGCLTKRAAVSSFLKFEKTAGQTDLHVIALGSYEGTGYNRNLDAFSEKDCISNHDCFVKAGRAIHRHHKNKKHDPKYGNIKASAYNPTQKRIELIIGLDNDKCADILDEQERKGSTNWSMASKQAYDVCSWCKHKAKDDSTRCEHIPEKLGELRDDGEICGMQNPNPKWFELSYVARPADRIGMSLKVAAELGVAPRLTKDYLQIYSGFEEPEDLESFIISKAASDKLEILKKLAVLEKHIDAKASPALEKAVDSRKKAMPDAALSKETIDELRKQDPKKLLRVLADNGIVLSPSDFISYLFGGRAKEEHFDGLKEALPGAFNRNAEDKKMKAVNNERFEPELFGGLPSELSKMVSKLVGDHSLFDKPMMGRVVRITIIGGNKPTLADKHEKKASSKIYGELADEYVAYKLAALNYLRLQDKLTDDLLLNTVIQN